jgi:DNA polymerase-3 subunit beta
VKLTVDRKELADAAKAVAKFLPRTTHLQSVSHIHIEAHSGIIALTATDLESGRRIEVEASVKEEGAALVPASLASVAGGASDDEVTLSTTKTHLKVDGSSSWKLALGRVEDYPVLPDESGGDKVPVDNWGHIRSVATAANPSHPKPYLQGVRLEDGVAAATDSYRLAYADFTSETDHPPTLIPARAINSLPDEVTALHIGDRAVRATLDDGAWWTRVIDAPFPNWRKLIEGEPTSTVKLDSEALSEALRRASLVFLGNEIPVLFTVTDYGLQLTRKHNGETVFSEDLVCSVEGDQELSIAFNIPYLRSMIDPAEHLVLGFDGPQRPVAIDGDGWWNAVLMPVRV